MISTERRTGRSGEATALPHDAVIQGEDAPHGRRRAHAGVARWAAPLRRTDGLLLRLLYLLLRWQERSRQRRQLAGLDDDRLKDIAVSRADAEREARKWFWQE
jgi:uncharacterized protein YjiS (DUF1127 family)